MTRWWPFVLWVWVSASERVPLSVLARNPQKRFAYEDEERQGPRESIDMSKRQSGNGDGQREAAAEAISRDLWIYVVL